MCIYSHFNLVFNICTPSRVPPPLPENECTLNGTFHVYFVVITNPPFLLSSIHTVTGMSTSFFKRLSHPSHLPFSWLPIVSLTCGFFRLGALLCSVQGYILIPQAFSNSRFRNSSLFYYMSMYSTHSLSSIIWSYLFQFLLGMLSLFSVRERQFLSWSGRALEWWLGAEGDKEGDKEWQIKVDTGRDCIVELPRTTIQYHFFLRNT